MDGTKIVFEQRDIFYCFKELLQHHVAFLHCLAVVLTLVFSFNKKMAQNNLSVHPRERVPLVALEILNSKPNVNLQHRRFFITNKEFEMRVNVMFSVLENSVICKVCVR